MQIQREQLSLYVPSSSSVRLEAVRQILDPQQHSLIPAHVTLLRDDEFIGHTEATIAAALSSTCPITLTFGGPVSFGGHGILLPCVAGLAAFIWLRERLVGADRAPRQAPHITLAHPRNPKSSGASLAAAASLQSGIAITFSAVQHVRQESGRPWSVLRTHALPGK